MTTFNTGNPVGSSDPRDLYDNAENADFLINGDQPAYNDRTGVSRKSWTGVEQQVAQQATEFAADQASRETTFANFLNSSGFEYLGAYGAGVTFTEYNQYVVDAGEAWFIDPTTPLPYTTTGAGVPEGGALMSRGEAVLRQELGSGIRRVDSLAGLQSISGRFAGDVAYMVGRTTAGDGGEGEFRWDASDLSAEASADPGRGIYVPATADPTGASGAWVRQVKFGHYPEHFDSIESALTWCSNNDQTLNLVDHAEYKLTSDTELTGSLRLRGKGVIKASENVTGIVVEPTRTVSTTVSSIATVQYPASTGIEQSTSLTVADASGFSVNDICQIRSDDTYTFDASIRRAQLVKVNAISGTTIYLAGNLIDTFTTNIVLEKLNDAVVDVDGPEFVYDGDPLTVTSKTRLAGLTMTGCVAPKVRARFSNDIADGLRLYSCWEPDIDVRCRDLRNNITNSLYGYGVSAYGSCFGGQIRVIADNVRHAYTDGVWVNALEPIKDGRCVDMQVYDSAATNCTFASFDTHPGSKNTRFVNCGAVFNMTNSDQPSRNNSYGFQDRGVNTKFINCWSKGVRSVFFFSSVLTDYGEDNTTEVIGGRFERFATSTNSFCGLPTQTSLDTCKIKIQDAKVIGYVPAQSAQTNNILEWNGVEFIGDGTFGFNSINNSGGMDFIDCRFNELPTMRLGQGNNFRLEGCRRINSGSNVEPLVVDVGSTCVIYDYYASAQSYGFGEIIRAGLGSNSGTVTIKLGKVYAENFTSDNPIGTNGVATLVIENMDVRQAPVQKGATGLRPSLNSADIGFLYMDTTLDADGKPIWWNGTAWVDATGLTV